MSVQKIALVGLIVALAGCASQTLYAPAEKRGTDGYTETRLAENRYRVTFTGNSLTPAETVKDYALLRSAELTLQKGYDWFRTAERDTDKKVRSNTSFGSDFSFPGHTTVYQRCGLISCSTAVSSSPGFSSGIGVGTTTSSSSYSSALEILMGKNPRPQGDVYDARELASTLRELTATPVK